MPIPSVFRALRLAVAGGAIAIAMSMAVSAPAAAADAAPPIEILAFGDSLVHGYGLDAGDPFPAQLEAALREKGYEARVINAGNSGDTSKSGRARLEWVLQDKVDAAIVVLGANDALRGIEPEVTYRNLDAVLNTLERADVPVLLAGMKAPRNMGRDYVAAFDALYERLAREHDVVFYPFFLQDVAQQRALNQSDGIHPNARGVAVIVDNILPDVEKLIARESGD